MIVINEPREDSSFVCPICGKSDVKPLTLIPIYDTEEGNIAQASAVHIECLDLTYYPRWNFIGMKWDKPPQEEDE